MIEVLADLPSCVASAAAGGVPKCLHVDFDRPFVNRMQSVPHLPFTGGMSTDAFLIVGGVLGALALSVVWFAMLLRCRGLAGAASDDPTIATSLI